MSTATMTVCPHCGTQNTSASAFCASCGKALPLATTGGPRVVTADSLPTSALGHEMVSEELNKQSKKAFGALLAVAIMQTVFGAIVLAVLSNAPAGTEANNQVFFAVFGIAAVFFVLAFWARRSPLPAAIVGLVLFVTVHLLDAVVDPTALLRGIIIKIIIIAVLIKAINAGLKHKKLMDAQRGVAR